MFNIREPRLVVNESCLQNIRMGVPGNMKNGPPPGGGPSVPHGRNIHCCER
jgi:hypothetical protein